MEYSQKIEDLLKSNQLFSTLSHANCIELGKITDLMAFSEGENIVEEGEEPDNLYVIISGNASVIKTQYDDEEKFEHEVAVLGPGDSIGDVTLIDRMPRSATVRALSSCELLKIPIDRLSTLSRTEDCIETKLKINFAHRLSQYLRNANNHTLTERRRHRAELTQLTNFDIVTGLPNQYLFKEQLTTQLSESPDTPLAVFQVEIVDYKEVCDALGTHVGEEFLTAISDRLSLGLSEVQFLSRVGFNQFMLVFNHQSDFASVTALASRIIHLFANPFIIGEDNILTNIYVGVAHYPDDGKRADLLIKHAGLALDAAKLSEPNSCEFYNAEMDKLVAARRKLVHELHEAYENDQFEIFYQAQVDLATGDLIGAEALIRWVHPTDGLISPAIFIPIVEQTGMIIKLGTWVFKMACAQAKMWLDAGHPVRVAVNLSALQFMQKDLVQAFQHIVVETGVPNDLIELEITESIMMSDANETIDKIQQFVDLGFILAIDDFGTGYSSLSALSTLPIHKLKIDQSFVRGLTQEPSTKDIVQCIISMGKALSLKVIAEGIETEDNIAFLKDKNCDEGQGYYFSKPLPAGEFEKKYF